MKPRRRWSISISTALVVGAFAGCREPTEIRVSLTTDIPCASFARVRIAVASTSSRAEADLAAGDAATSSTTCENGQLGTLVVTPGSTNGALLAVLEFKGGRTAAACAASGYADCIVSRRRFGFVDHAALDLAVTLRAVCKGIACDLLSTCQGGACVSSEVACDADGCPNLDPLAPPASTNGDAAPEDAQPEAAPPDAAAPDARDGGDDAPFDGGDCLDNPPNCGIEPNDVCCYYSDPRVPTCAARLTCMNDPYVAISVTCSSVADCSDQPGFACGYVSSGMTPRTIGCLPTDVVDNGGTRVCQDDADCTPNTVCLGPFTGPSFELHRLKICGPP